LAADSLQDHQRRSASFKDYIRIAKLVQATDLLHLNGGILAQPGDLEPDLASLIMVYTALSLGEKPLLGIQGTAPQVQRIMELGCIAFGGTDEFKSTVASHRLHLKLCSQPNDRNHKSFVKEY